MKESDYILASNLARLRSANEILRQVYGLEGVDAEALVIACRKLYGITERLESRVEDVMEDDDE